MRIRRLEEADAVAAGSLLARAFAGSPVFIAAVPDRARRSLLSLPLFVVNVRHACRYGEAWALQDPDGILLAVGYTVDRPEPHLDAAAAADLGFTALGRDWAPELQVLAAYEAAAARELGGIAEPWRYLGAIAVEPRLQGRGHGRALLAHIRAAAGGMAVGLVTDHATNVPFYERAGFSVTWTGTPVPGGPTFWAMEAAGQPPR